MIECFDLKKPVIMLCNDRKNKCASWFCYSFSAFIAVILVISLSGCGCGRKKEADSTSSSDSADSVPRMQDKQYVAELNTHRDDQKVVARERNKLAADKEACSARIKAGLSPDASQEDFNAALEKDEEWQRLEKQQELRDKDVVEVLREARETVRARMLKEKRETKAPAGS